MDNEEEMDKFLEKYNFPKLDQEEIENLNRPITSMETETVIRNLPANKSPGPDSFIAEFYQKFREELTPILLKLFQKIAEEGKLPNLFYEATITLIPKSDKDATKKKTTSQYHNEHRCKNPQQNFSKQNSAEHQKAHTPCSSWLYSRDARVLQYMQINVIHPINKLKDKNHMIISIDA